jgi:hypothetical protein
MTLFVLYSLAKILPLNQRKLVVDEMQMAHYSPLSCTKELRIVMPEP